MSDTENIVRDIFGDSDESDAEFEVYKDALPCCDSRIYCFLFRDLMVEM